MEASEPPADTPDSVAHNRRSATPISYEAFLATRRFPTLDGLRAVAILLVATAHPAYPHVWPLLHGTTGVSLFFVLSGFLITALCLREEATGDRFDIGGFYVRRVFRIYPLFFLVLLLYVLLIVWLHLEPQRRAIFIHELPWMAFLMPEHATYFNSSGLAVPFDGSWSLGIEEKFYLLWPVIAFVMLKKRFRPRVVLVAAVFLVCTACSILDGAWFATTAPYGLIAAGCWLALLLHDPRWYSRLRHLGRPRVLALVCAAVVTVQLCLPQITPGGDLYVVYGILLAAMLAGVLVYSGRALRFLSSRPFVFLGTISYAFYLLHNFGLNFAEKMIPQTGFLASLASTAIGLTAVAFICYLLHVSYEKPLIRQGHRLAARHKSVRAVPAVGAVTPQNHPPHRGGPA